MEELIHLVNRFHHGRVTVEKWSFRLNKKKVNEREVISSKFLRYLIKEGYLDIREYEWEYEFLLETLSQRHLVDFLLPHLRFSLISKDGLPIWRTIEVTYKG